MMTKSGKILFAIASGGMSSSPSMRIVLKMRIGIAFVTSWPIA